MSYILKQYDYNLAYFDIYYDIEGFRVENFEIVENNKHLLPLNLNQTAKAYMTKNQIEKIKKLINVKFKNILNITYQIND